MIRCNECGFINGFPSSSLIPPPLCLSLLGSARDFICSSAKGFYIGGGGSVFLSFQKFSWKLFFCPVSCKPFCSLFFFFGFPLFACSGVLSGVYVLSPFVIQAGIGKATFLSTYLFS